MKCFFAAVAYVLLLLPAGPIHAATATRVMEGDCPDGVTRWKVIITYDTESGKIKSTGNTTCAGITKAITYNYTLIVQSHYNYTAGTTSSSFSYDVTQFTLSNQSYVSIVNGSTGVIVYTFSSLIPASTWTSLPALSSGLYVLVAADPLTSTVTGASAFLQ